MVDSNKEQWTMPEWMEEYRPYMDSISGGNSVENLINDGGKSTVFNNAPRALICCQMHAAVGIVNKLHNDGKLK